MRPRRAIRSTALPSRRDVLAALAALGGVGAFARDALAGGDAPPAASSHSVVLYPNMGRVVLVFRTPPFGAIHVTVDNTPLSDGSLVPYTETPAPSDAPQPSASASAASAVPLRYVMFAADGKRSIGVTTENGYWANVQADVRAGGTVEVPVDPQPRPALGGEIPHQPLVGAGCCGGSHGSESRGSVATPSIAATAVAAAVLFLRRGADPDSDRER